MLSKKVDIQLLLQIPYNKRVITTKIYEKEGSKKTYNNLGNVVLGGGDTIIWVNKKLEVFIK